VRQLLRDEDSLLRRPEQTIATAPPSTADDEGLLPTIDSEERTARGEELLETRPVDADSDRRRRERRDQRALVGWLASGMRAGARRRRLGTSDPRREGR
jgi:hypothetical protein